MAEVTEPARMAHFAAMTSLGSGNASPEMRIDIVKPRPPMMPTAMICGQSTCLGSLAKPMRTRSHVTRMMPMGLPSTAPKYTPLVTGSAMMVARSMSTILTCAFTNAKMGRITKFTGTEM